MLRLSSFRRCVIIGTDTNILPFDARAFNAKSMNSCVSESVKCSQTSKHVENSNRLCRDGSWIED